MTVAEHAMRLSKASKLQTRKMKGSRWGGVELCEPYQTGNMSALAETGKAAVRRVRGHLGHSEGIKFMVHLCLSVGFLEGEL